MAAEPRWTAGSHPSPEELMLAREDEFPRQQAEPILAHLHQCWQCRAQVERHKRGIESYLQFRAADLDPVLAPRPGGWLRLSARIPRPQPLVPHSSARWRVWLTASLAAAAVVVAALVFQPASVTAKTVLDRAGRAEEHATQIAPPRILVWRGGRLIAPDRSLLQAARIDPARPLSARSFRAWHDGLQNKTDAVTTAGGELRLQTTTAEGLIALAWLAVGESDYEPRAKHVELRDGAVIDVDTASPPAPEATVKAVPTPTAPAAIPDRIAQETLELQVRWALHRIGADLGEPLRIEAAGDGLVVNGNLDDAGRRDQVAQALKAFPKVTARLAMAEPDPEAIAKAQPIEPGASGEPLLSDPGARGEFVSHALRLSHDILRHAWALRRLADRYPVSVAEKLAPEARSSLDRLIEEHRNSIRDASREAAWLWQPYVELDPGSPATAATLLEAAQAFDHLTVRLLAAGGNDGLTLAEAMRQMRQSFAQFAPENR